MNVSILGTIYNIEFRTEAEDKRLVGFDGYCDKTEKLIVVDTLKDGCNLGKPDVYRKKVLRHEIVHAFLFESGLHENATLTSFQDEPNVDWIAVQGPKLYEAWKEAGAL